MARPIANGSAVSVAANTKSADQMTGSGQYVAKGRIQLVAKSSATGLNITLNVGGVAICDDLVNPYTGTAGTLSTQDNVLVEQIVAGGRVELFLRNTTGGAITTDYVVYFTPM